MFTTSQIEHIKCIPCMKQNDMNSMFIPQERAVGPSSPCEK